MSDFGTMESACGQFCPPRDLADMLAIDVAVKNDILQFLWN
jgi:hypothetical protein